MQSLELVGKMELQIKISTPKGLAMSTGKKLKPFLLGLAIKPKSMESNEDDSQVTWVLDVDELKANALMKRMAGYQLIVKTALPYMKRFANSRKDAQKLEKMLLEDTKLEFVKL